MPWVQQVQSANWTRGSLILLWTYALGCFVTGYYLTRVKAGRDIRDLGSGNAGAKNTGRILGKAGFFVTLAGDVLKGVLAVWGTRHATKEELWVAGALLAVVAGHIWPIQLKFRGGKGVATTLGALLIYDYRMILAYGVCFGAYYLAMRRSVLPGLLAFISLPVVSLVLERNTHNFLPPLALTILASMILLAHRRNLAEELGRLIVRKEIPPQL